MQVSFRGELGIDSGGLEREYWTLIGREILRKYFEGEEGNCIVRRDTSSLMVSKPIDSKILYNYGCFRTKNIRKLDSLFHWE